MSDEQEENSAEEEEEEDEEEGSQEEEQGDDEDDQQEEQGDGEDQEQDEDQEQEGEEEQSGAAEDQSKAESEEQPEKLPKFRSVEPQEFKFTNLLSEISSLSLSVDHFISSLPSHGGSTTYYRSTYVPPPRPPPEIPLILPRQQSKVVIMKDEDTQVSMQPQIVIQPTRVEKQPQPSYKISNESNKFLAQLYEENKKLKRWQNSSHNMNTHNPGSSVSNAFYGSRERFQRQDYEKGLFNVEERNREIDEAIEMLKREQE